MIAAHQIAFGGGGAKGLSAKDYIQEVGSYIWDAKENSDWGVHDATITDGWTDLVHRKKMPVFTGSISFANDYMVATSAILRDKLGTLADVINNGSFTVEAYWNHTDLRGYIFSNKQVAPLYEIWANGTYGQVFRITGEQNDGSLRHGVGAFAGAPHYLAYSVDSATGVIACLDGEIYTTYSKEISMPVRSQDVGFELIGNSQANWTKTTGSFGGVRIHPRPFSAEEMQHNWQIDLLRYPNLPTI
jgi:hypothetical protein